MLYAVPSLFLAAPLSSCAPWREFPGLGKAAVTLHRRPQSGVQNFRAPWGKYDYYELIDHDLLPSHGIPAMCSQGCFGGYQSAPTVCKVALQYITALVSFYGKDVQNQTGRTLAFSNGNAEIKNDCVDF